VLAGCWTNQVAATPAGCGSARPREGVRDVSALRGYGCGFFVWLPAGNATVRLWRKLTHRSGRWVARLSLCQPSAGT
jgi:hypothetical protein